MDEKLTGIVKELEAFGLENDERVSSHSEKMLNITPDTGEFLVLMIRALQAKRVLEIGTSNGYSTLWLAYAVQPLGGTVTTVELLERKAELARANFARAGLSSYIQSHLVNAGVFLAEQATASFGLVFLDSNRREYVGWWRDLQRVLAPGGLIVVDNAVSHAHEMQDFVRVVHETRGYITSLVPVGKGEFLILKERG